MTTAAAIVDNLKQEALLHQSVMTEPFNDVGLQEELRQLEQHVQLLYAYLYPNNDRPLIDGKPYVHPMEIILTIYYIEELHMDHNNSFWGHTDIESNRRAYLYEIRDYLKIRILPQSDDERDELIDTLIYYSHILTRGQVTAIPVERLQRMPLHEVIAYMSLLTEQEILDQREVIVPISNRLDMIMANARCLTEPCFMILSPDFSYKDPSTFVKAHSINEPFGKGAVPRFCYGTPLRYWSYVPEELETYITDDLELLHPEDETLQFTSQDIVSLRPILKVISDFIYDINEEKWDKLVRKHEKISTFTVLRRAAHYD